MEIQVVQYIIYVDYGPFVFTFPAIIRQVLDLDLFGYLEDSLNIAERAIEVEHFGIVYVLQTFAVHFNSLFVVGLSELIIAQSACATERESE